MKSGIKTDSGYILELPGVFLKGDISKFKHYTIELEKDFAVTIHINKYFEDYVLEFIGLTRDGKEEVQFYCDMDRIEPFACEATDESKYILVINDNSQNYIFTCEYNGKTYDLTDMQTIIDLY